MNKKTFLTGAALLLASNFLVKIAGAVFKVPLALLLLDDGMGIFSTVTNVYMWALLLAGDGVPRAVSRMVAERNAKKDYAGAKKAFVSGFFITLFVSFAVSFALYIFSDSIAKLLGLPQAGRCIRAACPAVLFVSLTAIIRSFFEGRQNMLPTAVSEVAEAIIKLCVGYIAAKLLIKKGVAYAAEGAILGISAGSVTGFIIMLFLYFAKKRKYGKSKEGYIKLSLSILKAAIPICFGGIVASLSGLIDTSMTMERLVASGISEGAALSEWGRYSGFVMPLVNLPSSVLLAVSVSVIPAISGAYFSKNLAFARKITTSALRLTLVFALPCAAGLSVLSSPLLKLIYHTDKAGALLGISAWCVIPISICLVTNSILQGIGQETKTLLYMIFGAIVKALINYFCIPLLGIAGAPLGTIACYGFISFLSIFKIGEKLRIKISVSDFCAPIISTAIMSVCLIWIFNITGLVLPSVTLGGAVYVLMLFLTGAIKEEDIQILPKGDKIARGLKKIKLIGR